MLRPLVLLVVWSQVEAVPQWGRWRPWGNSGPSAPQPSDQGLKLMVDIKPVPQTPFGPPSGDPEQKKLQGAERGLWAWALTTTTVPPPAQIFTPKAGNMSEVMWDDGGDDNTYPEMDYDSGHMSKKLRSIALGHPEQKKLQGAYRQYYGVVARPPPTKRPQPRFFTRATTTTTTTLPLPDKIF